VRSEVEEVKEAKEMKDRRKAYRRDSRGAAELTEML